MKQVKFFILFFVVVACSSTQKKIDSQPEEKSLPQEVIVASTPAFPIVNTRGD
ncbi:hypothetical protein [Winogradskyella sp. MIT101101]|uniref:hypothetical protein n=1 Tax=Winogradskyella sp. MIT101101 TaxID=3098297 RepID=UPI0039999F88